MGDAQEICWQKAMSFCLKNDTMVIPIPLGAYEIRLNIIYKGKLTEGKRIFRTDAKKAEDQWSKVTERIYINLYNKLNR